MKIKSCPKCGAHVPAKDIIKGLCPICRVPEQLKETWQDYLVIGIYDDDGTRFADTYHATSPKLAEHYAVTDHPGLLVAGVIDKAGEVVA